MTDNNLDTLLGQLLSLWNQGLEQRKNTWAQHKRSVSYLDQQSQLTKLRQKYQHWYQFPVKAHRSILQRLDRAYKRFFKQGGYPRFKSEHRGIRSFEIDAPPKIKTTGNHCAVQIKGIGRLKFKQSLPDGNIKLLRVIKTPLRVKLQFVMEHEAINIIDIRQPVGIDLGIKDRIILSNGYKSAKNAIDRSELKRHQRRLARAQKDSNNRRKKRLSLTKQWQRVTERERGRLHELTSYLTKTYIYSFLRRRP